jgi:hypothetical protein
MRMVIARCSVDYAGRLSTYLPSAVRLLAAAGIGGVIAAAEAVQHVGQRGHGAPEVVGERRRQPVG